MLHLILKEVKLTPVKEAEIFKKKFSSNLTLVISANALLLRYAFVTIGKLITSRFAVFDNVVPQLKLSDTVFVVIPDVIVDTDKQIQT